MGTLVTYSKLMPSSKHGLQLTRFWPSEPITMPTVSAEISSPNYKDLHPLELCIKSLWRVIRDLLLTYACEEAMFRALYRMLAKNDAQCTALLMDRGQLAAQCVAYWTFNLVLAAVLHSRGAVHGLMGLVGEELFCRTHRFNVNALELASVAEHATLRFLLALVAVTVVLRQSKVMLYCRYGDNEAYAL